MPRWKLEGTKPYGSVDAGFFLHGGRYLGCFVALFMLLLPIAIVIYFVSSLFAGEPIRGLGVDILRGSIFVCVAVYLPLLPYRLYLLYNYLTTEEKKEKQNKEDEGDYRYASKLSVDDLPDYTLLVALYKESATMERLVQSLTRLQYPDEKLEILLLVEAKESKEVSRSNDCRTKRILQTLRIIALYFQNQIAHSDNTGEVKVLKKRLKITLFTIAIYQIFQSKELDKRSPFWLTLLRAIFLPLMTIQLFNSLKDWFFDAFFGNPELRDGKTDSCLSTAKAALVAIDGLGEEFEERKKRFKVVEVPEPEYVKQLGKYEPTTKPRALNYGLYGKNLKLLNLDASQPDGIRYEEYKSPDIDDNRLCVVYDAEDRPEEDQLLRVAYKFKNDKDKQLVCVQCQLAYENLNDNWIISLFKAEYSAWFDVLLPGLYIEDNTSQRNLVIPLGGTSNHFKMKFLRDVIGGWDAFNVTEDCDLGIWISRESNKRIKVLDSITWEVVHGKLRPWINQRSRWIKGYIQSYFVHMRNPFQLIDDLGWEKFLSFQMVIGSSFLLPLLNPIFWVMTAGYLLSLLLYLLGNGVFSIPLSIITYMNDYFILPWGTGSFFIANVIYFIFMILGHFKHPKPGRPRWIVVWWWLYWFFMTWAAIKALWQYLFRPYHWEKSDHSYVSLG